MLGVVFPVAVKALVAASAGTMCEDLFLVRGATAGVPLFGRAFEGDFVGKAEDVDILLGDARRRRKARLAAELEDETSLHRSCNELVGDLLPELVGGVEGFVWEGDAGFIEADLRVAVHVDVRHAVACDAGVLEEVEDMVESFDAVLGEDDGVDPQDNLTDGEAGTDEFLELCPGGDGGGNEGFDFGAAPAGAGEMEDDLVLVFDEFLDQFVREALGDDDVGPVQVVESLEVECDFSGFRGSDVLVLFHDI